MTNDVNISAPTDVGPDDINIAYHRKPGLWWLATKNLLLTIITLGIYSFWGKTNVRKHLWSSVHINDQPLEYTGTGGELFKGFLIAAILVIAPLYALNFTAQMFMLESPILGGSLIGVAMLIAFFFFGAGTYFARRYRSSRTLWRGIRGAQTGSPWSYAFKYFLSFVAFVFSLGWSHPALKTKLTGILTRETSFGALPFSFEGSAKPLYKNFALCWFGNLATYALVAFGIYLLLTSGVLERANIVIWIIAIFVLIFLLFPYTIVIYLIRELNLHTAYTQYQGLKFKLAATSGSLLWLIISNLLLIIFTLGIAHPVTMERTLKYFFDRLTISGSTDITAITQSQRDLDGSGEGLAGAFDVDGF